MFSKRDSSNVSAGSSVFDVNVYAYSSGESLFSFSNGSRFNQDVLADDILGEFFFVIYQAEIIHYRFDSLIYASPLVSYTLPTTATVSSALLVMKERKLVVALSTSTVILVFDYYNPTAVITYSILYTPSYFAAFGSLILVAMPTSSN